MKYSYISTGKWQKISRAFGDGGSGDWWGAEEGMRGGNWRRPLLSAPRISPVTKRLASESFLRGLEVCRSSYQKHLLHRLLKVLISVNKCTSAICLTCSLLQQYYQITNTTHLTNETKIKNSKNAVYRPWVSSKCSAFRALSTCQHLLCGWKGKQKTFSN